MCTRANHASVHDSFHALLAALLALGSAILALAVAAATIPWRTLRARPPTRARVDSTTHVEIQVHLSDGERVRAIERSCRTGLKRAARTWAPFALPLDRVEVIPSAPPLGKADIFDQWFNDRSEEGNDASALVVVSLGTSQEGRELLPDEIAGALVGQVERLVIDRYRREHSAAVAASTARGHDSQLTSMPVLVTDAERSADARPPDNVTDIRALLEGIKKSQPLVPAGSSKNGVHQEPDPAS
jgi:hypothetical protein